MSVSSLYLPPQDLPLLLARPPNNPAATLPPPLAANSSLFKELLFQEHFSVFTVVGRPCGVPPLALLLPLPPRLCVSRWPRAGQLRDGRPGRLNLQIFMAFDEAIIGNTIVSMLAHQLFKRIIISVFINIS